MMTFRKGYAGSVAGGKAMASYLLAGTLKPDTAKAAAYYLGEEATHQRARSFWDAEIEHGQELAGETVAELRPDLSLAFANRLGLDPETPLVPDVVANLLNITRADGSRIRGRQVHKNGAPVGFIDLTLSADKSLSVAWALAQTGHERDLLLNVHREAVADTMRYVQSQVGLARRGRDQVVEPGVTTRSV